MERGNRRYASLPFPSFPCKKFNFTYIFFFIFCLLFSTSVKHLAFCFCDFIVFLKPYYLFGSFFLSFSKWNVFLLKYTTSEKHFCVRAALEYGTRVRQVVFLPHRSRLHSSISLYGFPLGSLVSSQNQRKQVELVMLNWPLVRMGVCMVQMMNWNPGRIASIGSSVTLSRIKQLLKTNE